MPLLVKISANYADEFDCQGFWVVDDVSIETARANIAAHIEYDHLKELYFGTNECLLMQDLSDGLEFQYIVESQSKMLETLFPNIKQGFGTFPRSIIDLIKQSI